MGACTFKIMVSKEKYPTPQEAFDVAVDNARYDYGHAGYTGTIAEKRDFIRLGVVGVSVEDNEDLYDDPRISDKWGPAGHMFSEDDKHHIFVGWASE